MFISQITQRVTATIGDVIPDAPDYSGIGFLTGIAADITAMLLGIAQILSVLVLVISFILYLRSSGDKAKKAAQWMGRAAIVLGATTLFNVIVTGSLGFLSQLG